MTYVWAVHITTSSVNDATATPGPIQAVYSSEQPARDEARACSMDHHRVLAAAVTRYLLDEPGTRSRVALYANGKLQQRPHFTDNHIYAVG